MTEPQTAPRTTPPPWLWGVAVLCFAGIGALAMLALRGSSEQDAVPKPQAGPRTATDLYGRPAAPAAASDPGCGGADPDRPARMEFELAGGRVNFGSVRQDQDVEQRIEFRNAGSGPLCITRIETGCGCVQARIEGDKQRFEPGETGAMIVGLSPVGRVGEVTKMIRLTTNDYASPFQTVNVWADVSLGILVEPRYLQFGMHPARTPAEARLYLRSPRTEPEWKVTEVVGSRRLPSGDRVPYQFEVEASADDRFHRQTLVVSMPGLDQPGPFHDAIIIKTTNPDRPELLVQGRLQIVQRILSQRQRIALGWVGAGVRRPPQRTYLLPGGPEVQFKVLGVEVRADGPEDEEPRASGFQATFGSDAKGWWADVFYDGSVTRAGQLEATLVVRTDDAEQPEMRIRVSATVQEK